MTDQLFPYQDTGVQWLAGRTAALLADEPGLGKTAQLARAAMALRGNGHGLLIVCPAIARLMWARELVRWGGIARNMVYVHTKGPIPNVAKMGATKAFIISYDVLSHGDSWKSLLTVQWDILICDEAHYLKGPSNRAKAVYGKLTPGAGSVQALIQRAGRVWLASGTPAPNNAGELYNHLIGLFPDVIPHPSGGRLLTRVEFEDRYCVVRDTTFGRQIVGSRNMGVLREKLANHVLRRRKAQVLQELPPLRFTEEWLDDDLVKAANLDVTIPVDLADGSPDAVIDWLQKNVAQLGTLRRQIGLAKVAPLVELIRSELDGNNRKLIVFAYHVDVVTQITQACFDAGYQPVMVHGSVNAKARDDAVAAFQTNDDVRVFVGQVQAAGTAITLTAASDVLFAEASWTPSENYQAVCRAHRVGQRDGVLARFALLPKVKLDLVMQRTLARKSADIAALFD